MHIKENEELNSEQYKISEEEELHNSSEYENVIDDYVDYLAFLADILNKNTESYKCLVQPLISRSSLLTDPLYFCPELEDPDLQGTLWVQESKKVIFDEVGIQQYIQFCNETKTNIFRRVKNGLLEETLDLRYLYLQTDELKSILSALQKNLFVRHLLLDESFLKPEGIAFLIPLIKENKNIQTLSLKHCNIGPLGAAELRDCFRFSGSISVLDLSRNALTCDGLEHLKSSFKENISIKVLNLSHNELGAKALSVLSFLDYNDCIIDLDLSWNFFYEPNGMKYFMNALIQNFTLKKLNLSWNGIGASPDFHYVAKFIKNAQALEYLDLSNNSIREKSVEMLWSAIKVNTSLISINLACNPFTPEEAEKLLVILAKKDDNIMKFLDLGNFWFNKSSLRHLKTLKKQGVEIKYEGIYSNYKIQGPSMKDIIIRRAKYLGMKPTNIKKRKDIGPIILSLPDDPMTQEDFTNYILKKHKLKLFNEDLMKGFFTAFNIEKDKKVNIKEIKEVYQKLYPAIKKLAHTKKKKKEKEKEKKRKIDDVESTTKSDKQYLKKRNIQTQTVDIKKPKKKKVKEKGKIGEVKKIKKSNKLRVKKKKIQTQTVVKSKKKKKGKTEHKKKIIKKKKKKKKKKL